MKNVYCEGLPWFLTVMNLPAMQVIQVQSLGRKDPLRKENSNPFQYICLGNPMHRGVWQATVHGIAKGKTRLSSRITITTYSLAVEWCDLSCFSKMPLISPWKGALYVGQHWDFEGYHSKPRERRWWFEWEDSRDEEKQKGTYLGHQGQWREGIKSDSAGSWSWFVNGSFV